MKFRHTILFFLFASSGAFAQQSLSPGMLGSNSAKNSDPDPDPLNGNSTLGMTYSQSQCGLNYAQDSKLIQTRSAAYGFNANGTGLPAVFNISGIPNCATILKAYFWYTVSYTEFTVPATSVVINSASVPATNAGTSVSKAWGETGTVVYRADVTANVAGNGAYNIDITGLQNKNFEVDGGTLFVIYKDNGATYQGSLVLWDGCWSICSAFPPQFNTLQQTMTGINACGASTTGNAFLIVSDNQNNITPPQHQSTLNGVQGPFNNDFYNFDISNTNVTAAQATAPYGLQGAPSDCFCWSLMGLYYQTTSCTTCVPAAVSLTVTPTQASCGTLGSATAAASGAPAPYTYSWSTGSSATAVSNLAAGTYSCTVTDATGCSSTKTFTINVSTGPILTFTTTPVSCNGGSNGSASVSVSGGSTPYTYGWGTNPPQTTQTASNLPAGTYSMVCSDPSGCSQTGTVTITQPAALTASASVTNNVSCFGGNDGSGTVAASGGTGTLTYAWTPSGQVTPGATGFTAGTYSVMVTDANGCTIPQSITITEPTAVTAPATVVAATCGLADGSATVNPAGGTPAYTYLWLTSPVQTTQTVTGLAGGTYSVVVTDSKGCLQSQSMVITGGTAPIADFTFDPSVVGIENPLVNFTDASSPGTTTWEWNFGDFLSGSNDSSSLQNPSHSYSDTGTYCITLIITTGTAGCSDTAVHCLKVEPDPTFYIPNTFTPNLDGHNEIFFGYGTFIKEFNLMIFDRWGNLIFESNDLYKGWDGKVQGGSSNKIVEQDVYVWKVRLVDYNDLERNYIGHVNVVK